MILGYRRTLVVEVVGSIGIEEHAIGIVLRRQQSACVSGTDSVNHASIPISSRKTLCGTIAESTYHEIFRRAVVDLGSQWARVVARNRRPRRHCRLNVRGRCILCSSSQCQNGGHKEEKEREHSESKEIVCESAHQTLRLPCWGGPPSYLK